MAGGGLRTETVPSASWASLTAQICAASLCALAAACWLAASASPLLLPSADEPVLVLHRWSGVPLVGAVVVGLMTWFAGSVRGRLGLLVTLGVLLLVILAGTFFAVVVVPTPNLIHPLSAAVPYAVAGFVAAGSACVITLLNLLWAGGRSAPGHVSSTSAARHRGRTLVLAASTSLVLVATAGWLVVQRTQDYLLDANEYRTGGDLGGAPASAPTSSLTGGDLWRVEVPGLTMTTPAATDYGLAVASGQNVIMVDRATGAVRWRYARSDVSGPAMVSSTGGGHQVLVWWGLGSVYVLDAKTGQRVGHWNASVEVTEIVEPALPLVIRARSANGSGLARVRPDGSDRWTYPLAGCEHARAALAGRVVVVSLWTSCGRPTQRLVGIDAETGRELWSAQPIGTMHQVGELRGFAAGAVLLVSPLVGDGVGRELTAVDLGDGTTRWSRKLPVWGSQALPCVDVQAHAGAHVAMVACTWDVTDYPLGPEQYATTIRTYDALTGSTLQTITSPGPVTSAAVSGDGRVLLGRADPHDGWVLDVLDGRASRPSLPIGPEIILHHASRRTLTAVDSQVLVIESREEVLRSLR